MTPDLQRELSCNHCPDGVFKMVITSRWISEHIKCGPYWGGCEKKGYYLKTC